MWFRHGKDKDGGIYIDITGIKVWVFMAFDKARVRHILDLGEIYGYSWDAWKAEVYSDGSGVFGVRIKYGELGKEEQARLRRTLEEAKEKGEIIDFGIEK